MVKGVNKTIIEVNNTGSKIFEKVVFYVSPQYGNISPERLKKAAGEFSFTFDENGSYRYPLRKRIKLKKGAIIFLVAIGVLVSAAAVLALIL